MTERKVYKSEEKLKIVFEGMSGTISVSDLCRKYDIKSARFYNWKEKLVKSSWIFDDRGRKNMSEQRIIEDQKKEMARLKDVIAEITLENLEIKKKIGDRLQRGGRT